MSAAGIPGQHPIVEATLRQREATSPEWSAWVEANAGTGKTKVLTDRVTRLLLSEVPPQRILCLTFTKAAAAEMRNRLSAQLGRWAMADDATLDKAIAGLIDREPTPRERVVARRLFAAVLDAPGGINILTIHAFCQSLLKRFPLEAGVAPGFEILDEGEAQALLRQAQDEQLETLARPGAPKPLVDALAAVARGTSIADYDGLMKGLLGERAWLLARVGSDRGLAGLRAELARAMGCAPDDTEATLRRDACAESAFDGAALRAAAAALLRGGKTDKERGARLAAWLEGGDRERGLPDYAKAFLTAEGTVRNRLATVAVQRDLPGIEDTLVAEGKRLIAVSERIKGAALVERTLALLRLGLDITERFGRLKRRRGALDYDDLIVATRRLLETSDGASWVLYKLDGGIDHILVDEAQDTNPDQWEVIRRLTGEFFAGEGAIERPRTVFAVGDTKQSIFGFQRADPRKLAEMRDWFAGQIRNAGHGFEPVELTVSFRSTPAVLDAVDWVFARDEAAKGVAVAGNVLHQPSRIAAPGHVELWPMISADKKKKREPGDPPPEVEAGQGGTGSSLGTSERLARLIACHARDLIDRGERRATTGEKLHPGHFMVLVRRRNAFVTQLVRELKRARIDVAGVDRLDLAEELAIQDLMAMLRFVLLPQDDLNLACLLKSPLVGLDEEALFALAWKRPGSIWQSLGLRAGEPAFAAAHATLRNWLQRGDRASPFDFIAHALGAEGGRRKLLERLGQEAGDPIDEFLARALQYQQSDGNSLQGFVRWFEEGGGEIKRDLDANRRPEVRILTVHASKGLQAPIVYLPDTTRTPESQDRLITSPDGNTRFWLPKKDDGNAAALAWRDAMKERVLEEQNRLLYVAMTRAEDRLYIGGWVGLKPPSKGCWYERIEAGLEASLTADVAEELPFHRRRAERHEFDFRPQLGKDGWAGSGFKLTNPGTEAVAEQEALPLEKDEPLPAWAAAAAPAEPDPPVPLAPSQPLADEAAPGPRAYSPLSPADPLRWKRGTLLHELLRHLPALPAADRAEAARRFLAQPAHGLTAEQVAAWTAEVLAVTEDPAHAALFGAASRAEVPLIGTVKTARGSFTVSGQVDRLAVSEHEVLVVDYKTNRPPPRDIAGVALGYRRQLALYRALLQQVYPGRAVRAFLLWTAAPRLMEIDAKTLDNSMPYAAAS